MNFKNFDNLILEIKKMKIKRVLLQLPDGLRRKFKEFVEKIEREGIECFVSIETCYGACDIRFFDAKVIGCDAIINIGHKNMNIKNSIPVFYYVYPVDTNIITIIEKDIKKIRKFKRLCILSTVQYEHKLMDICTFFKKNGINSINGGTILGCNVKRKINIECDAFLVIASGKFHAYGLAMKTEKPVLLLNTDTCTLKCINNEVEKFKRKKEYYKAIFEEAKSVGVLVSTKPGQFCEERIRYVLKKLIEKEKKYYVFVFDELKTEKIKWMDIDIFINTACPRITDDYEMYGVSIINADDI